MHTANDLVAARRKQADARAAGATSGSTALQDPELRRTLSSIQLAVDGRRERQLAEREELMFALKAAAAIAGVAVLVGLVVAGVF